MLVSHSTHAAFASALSWLTPFSQETSLAQVCGNEHHRLTASHVPHEPSYTHQPMIFMTYVRSCARRNPFLSEGKPPDDDHFPDPL